MTGNGVQEDDDVRTALTWLAKASGNPQAFVERLTHAQQAYRTVTASPESLGENPNLEEIGGDVVAAFLAQAKSLLDDRRSYDIALASRIVPWVKQIGQNIDVISRIPRASEKATTMLRAESVTPDSVLLELLVASNYALEGFDVAFVEETKGKARTPDLRLSRFDLRGPVFVECKRLKRGLYELQEQARHKILFLKAEKLIREHGLSVHIDVTYTRELSQIPEGYLADRLMHTLMSPIITRRGYPWRDDFGFGVVRPANLAAVRQDIRDSSLYFGTKMARLLCGHSVRECGYNLAAGAHPDERDPRFIDSIRYGSVVTWQCIAAEAIQKKSRYVKSRLTEADQQLKGHGLGIAHLVMDMELQCESSDRRRTKNIDIVTTFRPNSELLAIYIHYIVPRISESHAWLVDETVDRFGQADDQVPTMAIFPASAAIDNECPAWRQQV